MLAAEASLPAPMENRLTVFIADDHPIFRKGLCEVIGEEEALDLVGEASDGAAALQGITECKPDVAILDVNMPKLSGLHVGRKLVAQQPETKVVLLTMHEDEELFNAAIDSGILAYVLKENAVEDLVNAIHRVSVGKTFISPSISGYLIRRDARKRDLREKRPGIEDLTPAEHRILKIIAQDKTSKEIAEILKISVRTVETHRQNISHKLNLSGSHSLVKFAFQHKAEL